MAELFLDISNDGAVLSLLIKFYVPMAHINKVIKVLNLQSALNSQWTSVRGAIETTRSIAKYHWV